MISFSKSSFRKLAYSMNKGAWRMLLFSYSNHLNQQFSTWDTLTPRGTWAVCKGWVLNILNQLKKPFLSFIYTKPYSNAGVAILFRGYVEEKHYDLGVR